MSAAILQGTPATTLDTDLWVDDLPVRQYVRILAIAEKLGATVLACTVVALEDDSLVNFLYRIDGLKSFDEEHERAVRLRWLGRSVRVVPIASIIQSKKFVGRPKDLAHIPLLEATLRAAGAKRARRGR